MPLTTRRTFIRSGTGLAAGAVLSTASWAQSAWPSKPIRIVVPYTAGGFTDQMARLLQVGLQQRLGQPVVVDNKPGANSIIGVDAVAKAAPDGHTFAVVEMHTLNLDFEQALEAMAAVSGPEYPAVHTP